MRNASGYQSENERKGKKKQSEKEHKHFLHKTSKQEAKRIFTFQSCKTRERKCKKKCSARAKLFFANQIYCCCFYRSRCFQLVFSVTRFYIIFEESINIKKSFPSLLAPTKSIHYYSTTRLQQITYHVTLEPRATILTREAWFPRLADLSNRSFRPLLSCWTYRSLRTLGSTISLISTSSSRALFS